MEKTIKKRKIKYKVLLPILLLFIILIVLCCHFFKIPITNIYIKGNTILSDQQVIELAGLENYPSAITNTVFSIRNKLEKSDKIYSAKVNKKGFTKIYIEVIENRPLYYDSNTNKIVMLDKTSIAGDEITPYLVNYVPDTINDKFIEAISNLEFDVLDRISEIQYIPNEVDDSRFYLTMQDGNYVYININNFSKLNNYLTLIEKFNNKKGILYLDSGEYFEIK